MDLTSNISQVISRVNSACLESGRNAGDVSILLATKTQPISIIRDAVAAFDSPLILGENRVQELVTKAYDLPNLPLHFIGPLQKNKINQLLSTPVTCIETIDSIVLARAVSERLENRALEVMIQVNVSGETQKAGCSPADAAALAAAIADLPNLKLTGFMCIGVRPIIVNNQISNSNDVRHGYQMLRNIRDAVLPDGELSMGMSTDLELAIEEGATIIRIGSAIFGERAHTKNLPS